LQASGLRDDVLSYYVDAWVSSAEVHNNGVLLVFSIALLLLLAVLLLLLNCCWLLVLLLLVCPIVVEFSGESLYICICMVLGFGVELVLVFTHTGRVRVRVRRVGVKLGLENLGLGCVLSSARGGCNGGVRRGMEVCRSAR
jgi:hypothetical protein